MGMFIGYIVSFHEITSWAYPNILIANVLVLLSIFVFIILAIFSFSFFKSFQNCWKFMFWSKILLNFFILFVLILYSLLLYLELIKKSYRRELLHFFCSRKFCNISRSFDILCQNSHHRNSQDQAIWYPTNEHWIVRYKNKFASLLFIWFRDFFNAKNWGSFCSSFLIFCISYFCIKFSISISFNKLNLEIYS